MTPGPRIAILEGANQTRSEHVVRFPHSAPLPWSFTLHGADIKRGRIGNENHDYRYLTWWGLRSERPFQTPLS
jgi:hypothetical protein